MMTKFRQIMAGIALGVSLFFAFAAMLSQSSGAKIFVYQGF